MTEPTLTNWNELKDNSLVYRINNEILHPMGYAAVLNTETGTSDRVLKTDKFEFPVDVHDKHKNNVTMSGLLATHKAVVSQIAAKFELDEIWHNIIDKTDWYFTCDEEIVEESYEFSFAENLNEFEAGNYYSIEVYGTSIWRSTDKEYFLVVGNDGCGNQDMYLFSARNLVKEIEIY
ncbi:hypothetical protein VPFG_00219 [Vibrio phage nt-1]|uniref:DUF7415 domain-containing protein n=1 Tax=Vibrio phage nt-1 TaxID=115992 RepID=R9TFH0_9CAUD|nr:hypothetical protein VPFG_00219 [Vibrio phage nt-1]AGN30219.2 hypothetical protein VPFG_00219 [Vibrio phage nt-1]